MLPYINAYLLLHFFTKIALSDRENYGKLSAKQKIKGGIYLQFGVLVLSTFFSLILHACLHFIIYAINLVLHSCITHLIMCRGFMINVIIMAVTVDHL